MSKRDVEEFLVTLRPKPVFEPSIRKTPSRANTSSPPASVQTRPETSPPHPPPPKQTTNPDPAPKTTPPILEPARPDQFNFRFAADRAFKEKFERLAEVLGIENASRHMGEILEQALDIALDKKDPKRKHERRLQKEAKRKAGAENRRNQNLARARFRRRARLAIPATYLPRSASESTPEPVTDASFVVLMEPDAAPERVSRSSTHAPSLYSAPTTSVSSRFCVDFIIA